MTWGKASKRSKGKGKLEREIAGGVLEAMVPSLSLSHDEYSSTPNYARRWFASGGSRRCDVIVCD